MLNNSFCDSSGIRSTAILKGFRGSPEFASFFRHVGPYVRDILEMRHYALTEVAGSRAAEDIHTGRPEHGGDPHRTLNVLPPGHPRYGLARPPSRSWRPS